MLPLWLPTEIPGRMMLRMLIAVPPALQAHLDNALARLCYLCPERGFSAAATGIDVAHAKPEEQAELTKMVLHAIYREKILQETLPLRKALIDAVTK